MIIAALVFSLFQQEVKSDPASEKIIREAAAKKLNKDPNDLTDEDFALITEFNLSSKELSDIKLLEKCTNLQELNLMGTKFPNNKIPGWMKTLAKLGIFDVSKRYTIDLLPLNRLINLQILRLDDTHISNIEPVKTLKYLQILSLGNTKVSDIKPLEGLTNLRMLFLNETNISNLKSLNKLHWLNTLDITGTKVYNLDDIKDLNNLTNLFINEIQAGDLELIKIFKNLQILWIMSPQETSLGSLFIEFQGIREITFNSYIGSVKITDEQIEDLKSSLPFLRKPKRDSYFVNIH